LSIPPDRYNFDAPPLLVERATIYTEDARWRFARTMPFIPHWYAIRKQAHPAGLGAGHEALYFLCRDWGYPREWHRRIFPSVDLGGWSFWMLPLNERGNGDFLNCAPLGVEQDPAPVCRIHRESMTLDNGSPYRQWHCTACFATRAR
jgi:hypothetical protein